MLDRVRATLRVCHEGTVVGFQTAAALWGFGVPEDDDVHVVVPAGTLFPHRPGITVHQAKLPFTAAQMLGVPGTPPARTAIDLARTLDRPTALAVLDAALYAGVCTAAELADEVLRHDKLRGVKQARELVPLADGRAECKQESHLRLILHDAGMRGFEPQLEVFDPLRSNRYPRYRLDLADSRLRIGVEYDGVSHTKGALRHDRRRHNWLDGEGYRMIYTTDFDLYVEPQEIVLMVKRAVKEAMERFH